jgi:hypothetical protein
VAVSEFAQEEVVMAVKTVKTGQEVKAVKVAKPVKAKRRNKRPSVKGKRAKTKEELEYEALMTEIENDPDAPLIAKQAVAYRLGRDKSGEPYLTIEQIFEQLGRRF